MKRGRPSALVGLLLGSTVVGMSFGAFAPVFAQESLSTTELVRGRIEALRGGTEARAAGRRLLARRALPAFYDGRAFEPAWLGPDRDAQVGAVLRGIRAAEGHGLDPQAYHPEEIEALLARARGGSARPADLVDLELLASDAFMVLGSHLLHGRVNPETIEPEWLANRRSAELHSILADALRGGRVEGALLGLAPAQPRYQAMVAALSRLEGIEAEGGWPAVPSGPRLEVGTSDDRVAALVARLRASGDLESPPVGGPAVVKQFDERVAMAVRAFQERHGLEADGVVGPATLAAMNASAGDRARQIELNLERWRWLPADLGERHIEVNIAGFDVKVVERGHTVRTHRAIVGREYRETPMFSGVMTYLVLSPYWHVPPTIAAVDKLPGIRRDPSTIASQAMTLLEQASNQPVDPTTVDWESMTGSRFNRLYRLRQDPGPANALGRVKFMFPNRHNVYLHDTPARELFDRTSRNFSSGCIRIEDPRSLAEYLLSDQEGWDRARIDRVIEEGVERTVRLSAGVPVHLLYWTAWADEDGVLHFRPDVYRRDGVVDRALEGDPPGA